jgi:hypothetical protein
MLYGTPWLPERWSSCNIFFPILHNENPDIKTPYASTSIRLRELGTRKGTVQERNVDLLSLGIVLLELAEKKSFQYWYSYRKAKGEPLPEDLYVRNMIALDWWSEADTMEPAYAEAVKRCLSPEGMLWGHITRQRTTLDDEEFRKAFYRQVVQNLEKAWREFSTKIVRATLEPLY